MLSTNELKKLEERANLIRQDIIKMLLEAGSGHSAGPLGMADIFTAFYFHILNHDPKKTDWPKRDRLVLSNGHICPVRYAAMAHAGYFSLEELKKLKGKIKIDISVSDIHGKLISDELTAEINEEFNDPHELVVRKTEFKDKRTFAINASKAAKDIKRELIEKLKDPQTIIKIQIEKTD